VVAGVVPVADRAFSLAWFLAALLEKVKRVEVGDHELCQLLDRLSLVYALFDGS
jgi:hypothetical protein